MPISTNSIIHYTDTFAKLKSILKEGFAVKYCLEELNLYDIIGRAAAHPMISFCDIPLSHSHKHFKAYGRYGIGLSKEWATTKGANPVLYLEQNSSLSINLLELFKDRLAATSTLTEDHKNQIIRLKCYSKNYSGPLNRKKVNIPDYKFYDEREWRIIPSDSELDGARISIPSSEYKAGKSNFNEKISKIRIKFEPKDISYIIVDKTNEIPVVVKVLKKLYQESLLPHNFDILLTKVCSTEQILNDY